MKKRISPFASPQNDPVRQPAESLSAIRLSMFTKLRKGASFQLCDTFVLVETTFRTLTGGCNLMFVVSEQLCCLWGLGSCMAQMLLLSQPFEH